MVSEVPMDPELVLEPGTRGRDTVDQEVPEDPGVVETVLEEDLEMELDLPSMEEEAMDPMEE